MQVVGSGQHPVLSVDSNFGDQGIEREIVERAGYEFQVAQCRTEAEVLDVVRRVHPVGVLVQFAPITAETIERLDGVRGIVRVGVGLDNINLDAAERARIPVEAVPDYCTDEVADHAIALLLAISRGIMNGSRAVASGGWPKATKIVSLAPLRARTIGIIGFGRIGQSVAERATAFGMHVVAYDPYIDDDALRAAGAKRASLTEAFRSDVVSLHLPADPNTVGLVGRGLLSSMPEDSILLNLSRGAAIDEDALLDALDEGRPAYAGLDVLDEEPPPENHPLRDHSRTTVTPHVAWYSPGAIQELRRRSATRLVDLIRGP